MANAESQTPGEQGESPLIGKALKMLEYLAGDLELTAATHDDFDSAKGLERKVYDAKRTRVLRVGEDAICGGNIVVTTICAPRTLFTPWVGGGFRGRGGNTLAASAEINGSEALDDKSITLGCANENGPSKVPDDTPDGTRYFPTLKVSITVRGAFITEYNEDSGQVRTMLKLPEAAQSSIENVIKHLNGLTYVPPEL